MKLVEAEKYAVNDEELLESNLVSAGCDHHPAAAAAAAPGMYSKIMRKSESMPARSSKPALHQTWTEMAMGISRYLGVVCRKLSGWENRDPITRKKAARAEAKHLGNQKTRATQRVHTHRCDPNT
ncbi:unnamed protein product [Sphagnum tenellum]